MRQSFASLTIALALLTFQCIAASAQHLGWVGSGFTIINSSTVVNGGTVTALPTSVDVTSSDPIANAGASGTFVYEQIWTANSGTGLNLVYKETAKVSGNCMAGNSSASVSGTATATSGSVGTGSFTGSDIHNQTIAPFLSPFSQQVNVKCTVRGKGVAKGTLTTN